MGLRNESSEGWETGGRGQIPAAWSELRAGGVGTMVGVRGWEMGKCETLEGAGGGS